MGVQLTNTLTGATSGAIITVDYTNDFTTLNGHLLSIGTSLSTLVSYIELNLGQSGAAVPGTLSNSASQMVKANAEILAISGQSMTNLNKLLPAIQNMSSQIAAVSSTMAQGVATQQIAVANQIQKNKFDQTATQAALERNGLPAVEVTSEDILNTIQSNVRSAAEVAASASATGLVTSVASTAISKATGYVSGMLPSVSQVTDFFTKLLPISTVDTETTAKKANADAASVGLKTGTWI